VKSNTREERISFSSKGTNMHSRELCTAESYAQTRVVEIWIRSDRSQQFVRFSFSSRKFAFDFSADSEEVLRRILWLNTSNCQLDRVELKQFFASKQLNNTSFLCHYYINVI